MNKIFISLCILTSIIFAISAPVCAAEIPSEDITAENRISEFSSSHIDADILGYFDVDSFDMVIKAYNMPIIFAFTHYSTINEVLNSVYNDQKLYAIVSDNKVQVVYLSVEGGLPPVKAINPLHEWIDISAYLDDTIIKNVSPDIVVYNVYYLWGESNRQGSALYYETNMGDYVYYHKGAKYLMPNNVFADYMKTLYAEMLEDAKNGKDGYTIHDWSKYKLNSPDFDPSVLLENANVTPEPVDNNPGKPDNTPWIIAASGAAVAVAAISAVLILRKRKASKA